MKTFTIVFSNYTARLFAWEGPRSKFNKRNILMNREIVGEVQAENEDDALVKFRAQK